MRLGYTGICAIDCALVDSPEDTIKGQSFTSVDLENKYGLWRGKDGDHGEEVYFRRKGYEVNTLKLDIGQEKPRYIVQEIEAKN
ncbi:MAG: hypothetical protein ABEK36_03445 [Candidatus Aenigmatarchaeota archaeon]